jgi:ligand-binding SRPBCC domain-containing protein
MKLYRFTSKQTLPITQKQAWRFFSSPSNIVVITPRRFNLKIQSVSDYGILHTGQVIELNMRVLLLFRITWRTAVTEVNDLNTFTDVQLAGPFERWTHKHSFTEVSDGTEITDEIEYAIPFGHFGRFVNFLFVQRELRKLFNFRSDVLSTCLKR